MNPLISQVHDGEFLCVPAGKGLNLDPKRLASPLSSYTNIYGQIYDFHPLEACPSDIIAWHRDLVSVRWSPATKAWSEERVLWDRRDQLVFINNHLGYWTQKVFFESPVVLSGKDVLHADYFACYRSVAARAPQGWESSLMASSDNGRSWLRRSAIVSPTAPHHGAEPVLARNQAGDLVCVIRQTVNVNQDKPMLLVHSSDEGHSWTAPRPLFDFGVFPRLLLLGNGVMVLSFGRPGVWLSFSTDGGHAWTQPQAIITGDARDSQAHSCGYTSLVALGRNEFLVVYSEFLRSDANGQPCKSILSRRVSVAPG